MKFGRYAGLSMKQRVWLSFCIMGIMMTNSVCWSRFSQSGIGRYKKAALSWMFRHSKIPWEKLLESSVRAILIAHDVHQGVLAFDDSEKQRSKTTKRIAQVHKVKDKESGGYFQGQEIVLLLLVTDIITLPVGVAFYQPDPARSSWRKENKKLKKKGVPAKDRPREPLRSPGFPTKWELALRLLTRLGRLS